MEVINNRIRWVCKWYRVMGNPSGKNILCSINRSIWTKLISLFHINSNLANPLINLSQYSNKIQTNRMFSDSHINSIKCTKCQWTKTLFKWEKLCTNPNWSLRHIHNSMILTPLHNSNNRVLTKIKNKVLMIFNQWVVFHFQTRIKTLTNQWIKTTYSNLNKKKRRICQWISKMSI